MAYRAPSVPCTRLVRDTRTDVLVVGMGVSGAMVAESLTAAGFRVILLDRRGPLLGSTPASTALVQYEIDVPLPRRWPIWTPTNERASRPTTPSRRSIFRAARRRRARNPTIQRAPTAGREAPADAHLSARRSPRRAPSSFSHRPVLLHRRMR